MAGQRIAVSVAEAALIAAFCKAADHRLESWQLIELLHKDGVQDPKAALELQIVRLRKKLVEAGAEPPAIKAVHGWGYKLCSPLLLR